MRLRRHETIKNIELLNWVRKLAFIDISLVPLRPPRLNLRRRLLGPLLSPLSLLRAHCANSNFRVPSSTDWRLNFLAYALQWRQEEERQRERFKAKHEGTGICWNCQDATCSDSSCAHLRGLRPHCALHVASLPGHLSQARGTSSATPVSLADSARPARWCDPL